MIIEAGAESALVADLERITIAIVKYLAAARPEFKRRWSAGYPLDSRVGQHIAFEKLGRAVVHCRWRRTLADLRRRLVLLEEAELICEAHDSGRQSDDRSHY